MKVSMTPLEKILLSVVKTFFFLKKFGTTWEQRKREANTGKEKKNSKKRIQKNKEKRTQKQKQSLNVR
jgi:hypothetical protein